MCVIIHLPAGAKIDKTRLTNAVRNNWHSYGLVTRIDGKLDIKRVVPKNGEVDPDEVMESLEKDEEFERILHVRHNTAGATTLRNCHPFDVYYDDHRQVVFMHNGTFNEYKPKKFDKDGKLEDDPSGPSDSITFAEENITPMLVRSGGNIEDPFFQKVVRKFWSSGNRGILISSDQDPWFIGDDWKKIMHDGVELKVSNDLYFDKLVRGPEYDRKVALERLIREQENESKKHKHRRDNVIGRPFMSENDRLAVPFDVGTSSSTSSKWRSHPALVDKQFTPGIALPISPLKEFDFTQPSLSQLSQSPVNICNDWDVYDREHLVSLANLTADEWNQMYADKTTMLFIADYLSSDYGSLYTEYQELEEKVKRQEKLIEGMALKLKGVK